MGVIDKDSICWICLESKRNKVKKKTWRHPCNCSLVAHEDCLLDWLSTTEKNNCPQCKSIIKVKYNKFYSAALKTYYFIVNVFNKHACNSILVITGVSILTSALYSYSFNLGLNIINSVSDSSKINLLGFYNDNLQKKTILIALVPIGLIISPCSSGLVDFILTILTTTAVNSFSYSNSYDIINSLTSFFPIYNKNNNLNIFNHSIPKISIGSPQFTLLLIPWIRIFYFSFYKNLIQPKLDKWTRRSFTSLFNNEDRDNNPFNNYDDQRDVTLAVLTAAYQNTGVADRDQAARQAEYRVQLADNDVNNYNSLTTNSTFISKSVTALLFPFMSSYTSSILFNTISNISKFLLTKFPVSSTIISCLKATAKGPDDKFTRTVIAGCLLILTRDAFICLFTYLRLLTRKSQQVVDYDPNSDSDFDSTSPSNHGTFSTISNTLNNFWNSIIGVVDFRVEIEHDIN